MNKDLIRLIEQINWQVWYYNPHNSEPKSNTELIQDPGAIARIIKNACVNIINNPKSQPIVDYYIHSIEILCYGTRFEGPSRLKDNPEGISAIIIEYCDAIIDICKSEDDLFIQKLNNDWSKKWLFFNNYESTSYIVWIDNIEYSNGRIVWSGGQISLNTENSNPGYGVNFNPVEKKVFDTIGLDDESEEEFLETAEILTDEEVKAFINNQLYWGFDYMLEDMDEEQPINLFNKI